MIALYFIFKKRSPVALFQQSCCNTTPEPLLSLVIRFLFFLNVANHDRSITPFIEKEVILRNGCGNDLNLLLLKIKETMEIAFLVWYRNRKIKRKQWNNQFDEF